MKTGQPEKEALFTVWILQFQSQKTTPQLDYTLFKDFDFTLSLSTVNHSSSGEYQSPIWIFWKDVYVTFEYPEGFRGDKAARSRPIQD
jgi:hypothetical protein